MARLRLPTRIAAPGTLRARRARSKGCLTMTLNLAEPLRESARHYPDKTAIVVGETKLAYAQLYGMVQKLAGGLSRLARTESGPSPHRSGEPRRRRHCGVKHH